MMFSAYSNTNIMKRTQVSPAQTTLQKIAKKKKQQETYKVPFWLLIFLHILSLRAKNFTNT